MLNRNCAGVLDQPQQHEVDVDDVLVAGQHQALVRRPRAPSRCGAISAAERKPISTRLERVTLGVEHGLDRRGEVPVEARLGGLGPLAEAQHHALLVRLHAIEAARQPDRDQDQRDRDQRLAIAAEAAAGAARKDLPDLLLAAAQQLLEIRRLLPARADRPRAPGRRRPASRLLGCSTASVTTFRCSSGAPLGLCPRCGVLYISRTGSARASMPEAALLPRISCGSVECSTMTQVEPRAGPRRARRGGRSGARRRAWSPCRWSPAWWSKAATSASRSRSSRARRRPRSRCVRPASRRCWRCRG